MSEHPVSTTITPEEMEARNRNEFADVVRAPYVGELLEERFGPEVLKEMADAGRPFDASLR